MGVDVCAYLCSLFTYDVITLLYLVLYEFLVLLGWTLIDFCVLISRYGLLCFMFVFVVC